MKWSKIMAPLAILGVLIAGVLVANKYVFNRTVDNFVKDLANKREGKEHAAAVIAPVDIVEIRVRNPYDSMTFRRTGKTEWVMTEPFNAEADPKMLGTMAQKLAMLKDDDVVEENARDFSAYDLTNPDIKVRFKINGSDKTQAVYFGRRSPTESLYYTLNPDTGKVFLSDFAVKFDFNGNADSYINKQIFTQILRNANKFSLQFGDEIYEFHKAGQPVRWYFDKPVPGKAHQRGVPNTLGWLKNITFHSIVRADNLPQDPGFDNPSLKIVITENGKWTEGLVVGREARQGLRYAKKTGDDRVFLFQQTFIDSLRERIKEFKPNLAIFFPRNAVKRLELIKNGKSMVFTRENKKDEWTLEGREKTDIDSGAVTNFIFKLRAAKNKGMVGVAAAEEGAKYGLKPPVSTVKMEFFSKIYPPMTLYYGKKDRTGEFAYFYSSIDPYIVKVEGFYSDFVPDSPEEFLKQ